MAEQKTIGQIARAAFYGGVEDAPPTWFYLQEYQRQEWEAAASAIWDQAVEACIEAYEEEVWRTKGGADFSTADLLRSLKRSDKTENGDA